MDLRELRAGLDPLCSPFTPGPACLEVGSARAQATVGNSTVAAELRMVRPRVSVALSFDSMSGVWGSGWNSPPIHLPEVAPWALLPSASPGTRSLPPAVMGSIQPNFVLFHCQPSSSHCHFVLCDVCTPENSALLAETL